MRTKENECLLRPDPPAGHEPYRCAPPKSLIRPHRPEPLKAAISCSIPGRVRGDLSVLAVRMIEDTKNRACYPLTR
jgi:hypothetical protein